MISYLEGSTNPSMRHPALINQHKHSPIQTVTEILRYYCLPNLNTLEGIDQKMEGRGNGRFPFSLRCGWIWSSADFPILPCQGRWPLLKITRVSYGLHSSPLFYLQTTQYSVLQSLQMNIVNHAHTLRWTITPKKPLGRWKRLKHLDVRWTDLLTS